MKVKSAEALKTTASAGFHFTLNHQTFFVQFSPKYGMIKKVLKREDKLL